MNTKLFIIVAFGLILSSCGPARQNEIKMSIDKPDAIVLLKIAPVEADFKIRLLEFDPIKNKAHIGFGGSGTQIHNLLRAGRQYVAVNIEPGTYVYSSLIQQTHWNVCFHKSTLSFSIKPGEFLFLGELGTKNLRQLQKLSYWSGQMKVKGNDNVTHFDNILPPDIHFPDEDSLSLAQKYVQKKLPQIQATLEEVHYQKANFKSTKRGLFSIEHCS